MELNLDHPIDDGSYPSYQHPTLREHATDLQRAYDCYHCLRGEGVKARYLPREDGEPDAAYKARLQRSTFTDFFRASLHAFAGILSKFSLIEPPPTLEAAASNIDLEGNTLMAWLEQVDALMLRDGGIAIQVEMPDGLPGSAAEEAAQGRRPYLLTRQRSKVLNWRVSVTDGVESLERVTLMELHEESDGDFGVKISPRYRVISRGAWQLFSMERDSKNNLTITLEDEGQYLAAGGQPLPIVPVIWYASGQDGFGQGDMPLRQVVEHAIEHFQQRSDLREKTHKCAMPVPVRIGATPPAPGEARRPLVLGPNSVVDLDDGGSFTFAEPSASSLAEQRQQIADVEQLIQRQTLGFLYGDGQAVKTATQASLEGAQTESAVTRIANRKASMIQTLMMIWVMFTGEELSADAGVSMNSTLYERPLEAPDIAQLQQLAGGVELISQRSAIEELQRGGRLKVTTSADEELERINNERPEPADDIELNELGQLPPAPGELET